jgi:GT2 family glycosyltransferase
MPDSPLVSILLINWNGKHFLETCIPTVLASDYKNMELIVLDCASRDGSATFVRAQFPSTRVVEFDKDPGVDAAYIAGAELARGEYLVLLNNDTKLDPNTISRMVEAMQHDRVGLVVPTELDWNRNHVSSGAAYYYVMPLLGLFASLFGVPPPEECGPFYVSVICAMIPKTIFLALPPNEHIEFYEEMEWCWRLHLNRIRLKVLDDVYVMHRGAGTIEGTPKPAFFSGRSMIAAHFVCLGLPALVLFSPLLAAYYLVKTGSYLTRGRTGSAKALLKGLWSFFRNIRHFWEDRKVTQRQRKVGDWEIVRKMVESCAYILGRQTDKSALSYFRQKTFSTHL